MTAESSNTFARAVRRTAWLLVVLICCLPVVAQEQFEEVISVVEVEIPVQVSSGGQPVGGLGRENFRVFDRGRERQIVGFRVTDLSVATEAPVQETTIEAPAGPGDRFFLAVFDTVNSERDLLARAVRSLRQGFIDGMHPSDRAGVAIFTSRGPILLVGFTRDRVALDAAFRFLAADLDRDKEKRQEAAEVLVAARATNLAELSELIGPSAAAALADASAFRVGRSPTINIDISPVLEVEAVGGSAGNGRAGGLSSGIEEAFAIAELLSRNVQAARVEELTESLRDLATLLRRLQGQKHLLLLSGGTENFDQMLADGNSSDGGGRQWMGAGPGMARGIREMAETFRRTGWQIDAFGVARAGELNSSLLGTLAAETGGDLYANYNQQFDAFARLLETTEITYWLTFQCDDIYDNDRFRRLRVELVDGPARANVAARKGYYGQARSAASTDLQARLDESEDLLYGPDRHDFPVDLVTLQSPTGDGQTRVSLLAWTAGGPLLAAAGRRAQVSIHAVARVPDSGVVVDLVSEFRQIDLGKNREDLLHHGFQFLGDLVVPNGTYDMRFRLANRATGRAFLTTSQLTADGGRDRSLVGPMVLQAPSRAPVLITEAGANLDVDAWSPFAVDGKLFVPSSQPTLHPGAPLPVHIKLFGEWLQGAVLDARLRSAQGNLAAGVPLTIRQTLPAAGEGAPTSVLATLPPVDIQAGRYFLEILWHDGETPLAGGSWPVEVVDEAEQERSQPTTESPGGIP